MITAERLRELFSYEPESGIFVRLASCGAAKGGAPSGCLSPIGYLQIRIDGTLYYAHRLAWLYVHGCWPVNMVDHIDGCKTNNRFVNLRAATNAQNICNAKIRRDNTSGFKGVRLDKRRNLWMAEISVSRRNKFLGYFTTCEEAAEARRAAEVEHQGEFARSAESTRRAEMQATR